MTAHDYLTAIYDGCDGLIEFRALPGARQCFARLADLDAMRAFAREHAGQNLYHAMATRRDASSGTLANAAHLPCLYSDLDIRNDKHPTAPTEPDARASLARCALPPSIVVHSGGGLYPMWLLREPTDLRESGEVPRAYDLLRRLAAYLSADASAAEPARILRLPGTRNHKYTPARTVTIETFEPERRYHLSEIDEWLPTIPRAQTHQAAAEDGPRTYGAGERNAALYRLARSNKSKGISESASLDMLRVFNQAHCEPPHDDAEVQRANHEAYRQGDRPDFCGADDPAARYARVLELETLRERARREARRTLDAETRGAIRPPALISLRDWLAEPDSPTVYRVEDWQPADSRVMFSAPFKGGKTTARDNLVRCLADGGPWLGRYTVRPVTDGTIVALDTEMSRGQLRGWLREQRIRHDDHVIVEPLRGAAATLDLLDDDVRGRWVQWLRDRQARYLILDCLRPVLDALGLDEHHDAGRFLVAFDRLLADAGIAEALIIHHMGHAGERARGDSRLRDWPDVEWRIVRQDEDPASPRYIMAYGRDVDVPESLLVYDHTTRRLTIAGGSRHDATGRQVLGEILAMLEAAREPCSGRAIEAKAKEAGSLLTRQQIRAGLSYGIRTGAILAEPGGPRGAILHRRAADPDPHTGDDTASPRADEAVF